MVALARTNIPAGAEAPAPTSPSPGAHSFDLVPLIPRTVLFGNPTQFQARLAPDASRFSFLAPSPAGVLNVWLQTLGAADAVMITNDTHRGILQHLWTYDSQHIVYLQDELGEENDHLFVVHLATGMVRDLTPFPGVRAQNVMLDRKHPGDLLVGLNLRDRRVFDMYRVDVKAGTAVLDTENPGDVLGWMTDPAFEIRAALASGSTDGSTTLRVRDNRDQPWRDLVTWPFGENGNVEDFAADGRSLFVETTTDSDTARLVEIDAQTGEELRTLAENPKADVGRVLVNPDTHVLEAVSFDFEKEDWTVLDDSVRADFAALSKLAPDNLSIVSRDLADRIWIVAFERDRGSLRYVLYDRDARSSSELLVSQPELEEYALAPVEPVIIKSRDGLDLVSYLTLPPGVEPVRLPFVLNPHGGPQSRNTWGYRPNVQWLANRGYAVLQVNFRGSTGYGKSFLNAGNGEWGQKMQNDLTDAVLWAVERGIADPARVAILGGSYGGYAVLAGLAFTPELYACGVDMFGPSNLRTLLASAPPYWELAKKESMLRIGDVEHDEALNRRLSPLFHVDAIRAPLLIGQGANDVRVKIHESDQIAAAVRQKGVAVEYVVYTDEGHSFVRPENRFDFFGRAERFLAQHLGGRCEPWSEVPGASVEVRRL
ncbi:MAG: S9 family peptidase [Candidatus Schekmanbacteria bacterium]|nr:S9 family peptidase [Candidatus Schekmanbacteria bacterium]